MKKLLLILTMFLWVSAVVFGQAVHTKGEKVGENGTLVDSIITVDGRLKNYTEGAPIPVWTDANDSIPELRTDIDANTLTGSTNATNISDNAVAISGNASDISDNTDDITTNTGTLITHTAGIASNTLTNSTQDDSITDHRVDINATTAEIRDTVSFGSDIITQWSWVFADSSLIVAGTSLAFHYWNGPDTLYVSEIRAVNPINDGANVEYNIYHGTDITTPADSLFDGSGDWAQIYGGNSYNVGETHEPARHSIPPDHWVWIEWKLITSMLTRGASLSIIGYVY